MSGAPPAGTIPVREMHRFDVRALERFLAACVPGFAGPLVVRQFEGGQSNPTFSLEAGGRRYVMRKKPPGKLLPSAHAVDREFRVISALSKTDVPVAKAVVLCEDDAVIGTPFYVMAHVEGRIFRDPTLPGLEPAERAAIYDAMNDVLARLHKVDVAAVGLSDYGKPGNYFARQLSRWTRQYALAKTTDVPAMDALIEWLPKHMPVDDETTLVHGDYRLENMIFHPTEPRVLAVLDWELSTLGHPLADLAYNCILYHSASATTGGLVGLDFAKSGIPSEAEYVAAYCRRTGREGVPDFAFCLAFSLFRLASIAQGVYARGLQGNASSERATQLGDSARQLADRAWAIAQGRE
ncbi:MAG TPA: phosphotransferase [Myxococcota bacterium]|jgi:aminoglycoside phosphotransferase (APT) family kinase protein|nr:phosphotransferase [Myxococcota bacterium]